MMELRDDNGAMRGLFSLRVYRRGELIEEYEDHNLIVAGAKTALAALIAGSGSGRTIAKIGFGTNGSGPATSDTGLTGAYTKAIASYSFPAAGQVQFAWELLVSEATGLAISEFGLICADGSLFARKTRRQALQKDSDISLEGKWLIIF